ncbi:hypothetical protein LptCag_2175 [Leptospirillum ferriphilum]|uniref:Uncharacterized protein n=1 Tax=Leptospirillum ferriphilum TaxID=178606 RepID=A0A094WDZ8_9BACT|nr:hypothetical protein LptCag_2175 [Leptospirillum ferriphilum]
MFLHNSRYTSILSFKESRFTLFSYSGKSPLIARVKQFHSLYGVSVN